MTTRHITQLFGGNHGIHELKKVSTGYSLSFHPTLTLNILDCKKTIDSPVSSLCVLLLSWGSMVPVGSGIYD